MLRIDQRVSPGNVKLVIINVVQEHIDTAKIVVRQIDLLSEETLPDIVLAEDLRKFQQQRSASASRVINLVDFCLADDRQPRQQFGHLLRRKILTAALAGIACIHAHQVFVCVAKGVDRIVLIVAEFHVPYLVEQLYEFFIPLRDIVPEFVGIDINIIKKP